ncbi:MAG: leucine-rich repeat domain-containing protein [Firmicutes bacterium]|nr:leucine-rich repeat domain-containing protein [Bacillota bacterium]
MGGDNHQMVGYGYQYYTYPATGNTYFGYIVHYGWRENNTINPDGHNSNVWINSSWLGGYVALKINHTHNYVNIGGSYNEVQCSVCGHRKSNNQYSINNLSDYTVEITDVMGNPGNVHGIPMAINGRIVSRIGASAFEDESGLAYVIIPSTVTSIGQNAFANTGIWNNAANNNVVYADKWAVGYKGTPGSVLSFSATTVGIGDYAFQYRSTITTATIPASVEQIGEEAFGCCYNLSYLNIVPGKLKTIGKSAFLGCSGLFSILVPSSVETIGQFAFYGCTQLAGVTVPSSVTSIGAFAFAGCSGLVSIALPFVGANNAAGGTAAGLFGYIFGSYFYTGGTATNQYYSASGYATYYIPASLKTVTIFKTKKIPYGAFYNCSGLTGITLSVSVTTIDGNAFTNCMALKSLNIPDGVTSIASNAFTSCNNLAIAWEYSAAQLTMMTPFKTYWGDITIPDGAISIPANFFQNCARLTNVSIPNSVTGIGQHAFQNCSKLVNITIPSSVTTIGQDAFNGCSSLTSVTIPPGVVNIEQNTFYGCGSLTSVNLNNVKTIGTDAFADCTGLRNITIPSSVTSVHTYAFYGCHASLAMTWNTALMPPSGVKQYITEVNIPAGTTIAPNAFSSCGNLTSVSIPSSVTTIGAGAFSGCSKLASLTLPFIGNTKGGLTNTNLGYIFGGSNSTVSASLKSVEITGDADIGNNAFQGCGNIRYVYIQHWETEKVGNYAFQGCGSLQEIYFPWRSSISEIGNYAFDGCISLSQISLPEALTKIGDGAFRDCKSIYYVTIPASVTSLGSRAFQFCDNLTGVSLNCNISKIDDYTFDTCGQLTNISIPTGVASIGEGAFIRCANLSSVWFGYYGAQLQTIKDYAFDGCGALSSIPLTSCPGLKTIGMYAFWNCTSLTSITVPTSVTTINGGAFLNCSSLTIYAEAASKPAGWDAAWNPDNRPVVWGGSPPVNPASASLRENFTAAGTYTVYFTPSESGTYKLCFSDINACQPNTISIAGVKSGSCSLKETLTAHQTYAVTFTATPCSTSKPGQFKIDKDCAPCVPCNPCAPNPCKPCNPC